jgi:LemA protein
MASLTVFLVVVLFLAVGFMIYLVILYNGLVFLKVNTDKAWANIDVLLKQRHDEVPNLIAVVEGIKNFEQKVLTDITQARSASMAAVGVGEKAQANQALSSSLNSLFAVAENYPQLKAQANFLQLQKRLSGLESEIADRRSFYNDSVAAYNSHIAQFPDAILAGWMKLAPKELFQVSEGDKPVVPVNLSGS